MTKAKTVVISGAAGQLGSLLCEVLGREGFECIGIDRSKASSVDCCFDITNETAVTSFFTHYQELYGLINCAGCGVYTPFLDRTWEEFNRVMGTNAWGTFLMSKEAIKASKNGLRIINIASIYGHRSSDPRIYGESGRNNSEVYTMSKAAVLALTRYTAAHFASLGVRCNSVSPGGIFNNQSKDFVENYQLKTPVGIMAKPEDIASACSFLLSEQAHYLNGADIPVDGGFLSW